MITIVATTPHRHVRLAAFAAALVTAIAFALGAPTVAPAAPTAAAGASPASPLKGATSPVSMDVQLWPSEAEGAVLIASAELAPGASLPATVAIPLPSGAVVNWAGEVLGGAPENDLERPYAVGEGNGGRFVVLQLTKTRIAQYDAIFTDPSVQGGRYSSRLDWVQSTGTERVIFRVKFSDTAGDVAIDPPAAGAPQTNAAGERLYTLAPADLTAGERFTLAASFTRVQGSPGAAGAGGGTISVVLIVAVVLLVIAVIALALVLARRGRGTAMGEPPVADDESETFGQERAGTSSGSDVTTSEESTDDPFDVD